MPTYDYMCKSCGHQYELFHSMSDDSPKVCPECGKETKRLVSGGSAVIFKGSGYYVNDSKKNTSPSCAGGCK